MSLLSPKKKALNCHLWEPLAAYGGYHNLDFGANTFPRLLAEAYKK